MPATSTQLMPIGAAEQGAIEKAQGFALGDKGLLFSGQDFPQSTWPGQVKLAQVSQEMQVTHKPGSHVLSE